MPNLFGFSKKFWKKSNSHQKLIASKIRILVKIWSLGNSDSMKNFIDNVRYFKNL